MQHRAFFLELRYGLLLLLTACSSSSAGDPSASEALPDPAPSSVPANPSSASGNASTAPPSASGEGTSPFVIIPPAPTASVSNSGPAANEACRLAILGDPGSNPGANFAQWINERGPVVDRYAVGPDAQGFTLTTLSTYQVLLLDRLAQEATVGILPSELMTWVEGGGRVIALSGYDDYPEAVAVQNQLLAPLSLGFVSESPVWGPVSEFAAHPITQGLATLTFVGGRQVNHAATDTAIMWIGNDISLPVGVVATRGTGRLFLFGDEWVTYDSEWAALPEIEQFWVNVFDWLGGCKLTAIPMVN
jgi:hypothetical protein